MHTTNELIDLLRESLGVPSDMQVAANLELGRQAVSFWRRGFSYPSDSAALKIADLLEMDPTYVLACIHADREPNARLKSVWVSIAKHAKAAGLALLSIIILSSAPGTVAKAAAGCSAAAAGDNLYIMRIS